MSHDISFIPDPTNRTASNWVDYFKIMYSAAVQGESVSANGRSVALPPMAEIKKELLYWQNEVSKQSGVNSSVTKSQQHAPMVLM